MVFGLFRIDHSLQQRPHFIPYDTRGLQNSSQLGQRFAQETKHSSNRQQGFVC